MGHADFVLAAAKYAAPGADEVSGATRSKPDAEAGKAVSDGRTGRPETLQLAVWGRQRTNLAKLIRVPADLEVHYRGR